LKGEPEKVIKDEEITDIIDDLDIISPLAASLKREPSKTDKQISNNPTLDKK
jgi:hypothetical protein